MFISEVIVIMFANFNRTSLIGSIRTIVNAATLRGLVALLVFGAFYLHAASADAQASSFSQQTAVGAVSTPLLVTVPIRTSGTVASVQVVTDRPERLAALAPVVEQDLPSGVAAQIEMARFGALSVADRGRGA